MRSSAIRAALVFLALAFSACGAAPYDMEIPESFKRFEESREYKLITADGVRFAVREIENYPKADLAFWTDAMRRHLESQGYVVEGERCFETSHGLEGCTEDFLLPYGSEDWALSETVFVIDDRIVLVEAAGVFERFSAVEEELEKAMETFRVD